MKNTTTDLTHRINSFDRFYMFSDSSDVYRKWSYEEKKLKEELNKVDLSDLRMILSGLNENGIETVFGKRIKEYLESLPVETKESIESEVVTETTENTSNFRSEVLITSWEYYRKGICKSFSDCLKMAWRRYKALKLLRSGIGYVTYQKANGEVREAIATLRNGNFNYPYRTNEKTGSNPEVIKYYDIQKRAWRSFRVDRMIDIAA